MEPTFFALYRGFEFQCSPERVGAGAFAPRLVIHDTYESLSLEIPVGAPSMTYEDPTAAAHQAFAHGRRWVDSEFGEADIAEGPVPELLQIAPPRLPG
jgi:hypothetical protein